MKEFWRSLKYDNVSDIYEISTNARIRMRCSNPKSILEIYHSSNGYDFIQLILKDENLFNGYPNMRYFPLDELVAATFCECPRDLIDKPIKVEHIDGDLRNNHYENLRWVEDIEEWRDIENMPFHQISNWGNIRKISSGKTINLNVCDEKGYKIFCFKNKHYKVHRLVLFAFLKNDNCQKIYVNHIDEIRCNNYFKNLEWVTPYENSAHGVGLLKKAISLGKPLMCVETGEIYFSTLDAERKTGISSKRIWECCYNKINKAGGYSWKWINGDKHNGNWGKKNEHTIKKFGKKVKCVETGRIYNSLREACRECNIDRGNFRRALLNYTPINKCHWKLVEN